MSDQTVERYMNAVIATLTLVRTNVEEAMRLMVREMKGSAETQQVQLLALRRYLRLGEARVFKQWAWTPAEAAKHTAETQALMDEAFEVAKAFEADNPGFQLSISKLRDLERQVHLWCKNQFVHTAARGLIADAKSTLAGSAYQPTPTAASTQAFRSYLQQVHVKPEPTSAAPGTSDHGQQHAVDFVVMTGTKLIAGVETSLIGPQWYNTGFDKKLKRATEKTPAAQRLRRPVLQGPLQHPYEPWHYSLPKGSASSSGTK